jgi:hypothetical protein
VYPGTTCAGAKQTAQSAEVKPIESPSARTREDEKWDASCIDLTPF